jgi:Plant transposon protein
MKERWRKSNEELQMAVATHISRLHQVIGGHRMHLPVIEGPPRDHRTLPRPPRSHLRHGRALLCTRQDYTGLHPTFRDRQFEIMFRLSRPRFQRLLEDVMAAEIPFFKNLPMDAHGRIGAALECRLLLPLKTMAYGVPSHTFRDYFQMSETLARESCLQFHKAIKKIYQDEYLRLPDQQDLKNIVKLHKSVHGIDGMFGSIDCMHTTWKNCPVAWQGSFKGKEKKPTIVLEALCDHQLWFWHAAYGYAGVLNDITILNLSPFLDSLIDGSFNLLEAGCTPYTIGNQSFKQLFILVDGVYPQFSRFVQGYKMPIGERQKRFTEWQEAVRKDIERAFAVLQGRWQCIARPLHQLDLGLIGLEVCACLILHNMGVSDRVMEGDVRARYNPANSVHELQESTIRVRHPRDLAENQAPVPANLMARSGAAQGDAENMAMVTRSERWTHLRNLQEHIRLFNAIMDVTINWNQPRLDKSRQT